MLSLDAQSAGDWSAIALPGDKSIAHRALLCAALAVGESRIVGVPDSDDVRATLDVLTALQIAWRRDGATIVITGCGGRWPARAECSIAASGTTLRLTLGLLAAGAGEYAIRVGPQLARRSMQSVVDALARMGAQIVVHDWNTNAARIVITGQKLRGMHHTLAESSAQLKSALTFAALQSAGETVITEPQRTRDHLERMLPDFGVDIRYDNASQLRIRPQQLQSTDITIPGDASAVAFWAVGAILRNTNIEIPAVNLNPHRIGWITSLKQMHVDIRTSTNDRNVQTGGRWKGHPHKIFPENFMGREPDRTRQDSEPCGQIAINANQSSSFKAIELTAEVIPGVIDELPILAIAAAFARGTSRFHHVTRLRGKESDRIAAMQALVQLAGRRCELTPDDTLVIHGDPDVPVPLGELPVTNDHRIIMAAAMLALRGAPGALLRIADPDVVAKSYPDFWRQYFPHDSGVKHGGSGDSSLRSE